MHEGRPRKGGRERWRQGERERGREAERADARSRTNTNGPNPEKPRGGGSAHARVRSCLFLSAPPGPFRVRTYVRVYRVVVSSVSGAPISQLAEMRSQSQINDSAAGAFPRGRGPGLEGTRDACAPGGPNIHPIKNERVVHARHNARGSRGDNVARLYRAT